MKAADIINTNTSIKEGLNTQETQPIPLIGKQSITLTVLKKTGESVCSPSEIKKDDSSGITTTNTPKNPLESILGENLLKRREITYLAGSQIFFSDKNEVLMRKAPNLIMSPYECIRQLKYVYNHIENLKAVVTFFSNVLNDWENHTQETTEEGT